MTATTDGERSLVGAHGLELQCQNVGQRAKRIHMSRKDARRCRCRRPSPGRRGKLVAKCSSEHSSRRRASSPEELATRSKHRQLVPTALEPKIRARGNETSDADEICDAICWHAAKLALMARSVRPMATGLAAAGLPPTASAAARRGRESILERIAQRRMLTRATRMTTRGRVGAGCVSRYEDTALSRKAEERTSEENRRE